MQEIKVLFAINGGKVGVRIVRIGGRTERGAVNSEEPVTFESGIRDIISGKGLKKELESGFVQFIPLLNEGRS